MDRLLNSEEGNIVISILWGLGLAFLFFKQTCNGDNCIVYSAPDIKKMHSDIYAHKNKNTCYKYKTYTVDCEKKEKHLKRQN